MIKGGLTQDRAAGIAGAEKQDVHVDFLGVLEDRGGSTAGGQVEAERKSAHISG